jgi:hypothetical protein
MQKLPLLVTFYPILKTAANVRTCMANCQMKFWVFCEFFIRLTHHVHSVVKFLRNLVCFHACESRVSCSFISKYTSLRQSDNVVRNNASVKFAEGAQKTDTLSTPSNTAYAILAAQKTIHRQIARISLPISQPITLAYPLNMWSVLIFQKKTTFEYHG